MRGAERFVRTTSPRVQIGASGGQRVRYMASRTLERFCDGHTTATEVEITIRLRSPRCGGDGGQGQQWFSLALARLCWFLR